VTYVLQNVVFPLDRAEHILPLYVALETPENGTSAEPVLTRTQAQVPAHHTLSLSTYFNAFPASYWRHWSRIAEVRLTVATHGNGTIQLYRSSAAGVSTLMESRVVTDTQTTEFAAQLDSFDDGGWLWFDVTAGAEDVTITSAFWTTERAPERLGKASLGITTFNKPGYCRDTLSALAGAPELLEYIDRIFLIDQGTDIVADQHGFAEISHLLGDTLQIIRQPNLGGSGGFSRAMLETMQRPESEFVQLLDDDVAIEPESIRRSIVFARYATSPVLVGGHMLDLLNPTRLHAWAEVVDEAPFMWRPVDDETMPHDFAASPLRSSPALHRRIDADFNGWWMCLIPVAALREVGLAFPAFIKWDDAEFCLRAGKAGFATVSMPGVALWHISWVGKDDLLDWQAYFHARNRIVAALLHSEAPQGGTLLKHSRRVDLKHLMAMQYYPVAVRAQALRDVLSGPAHLTQNLPSALATVRAFMGTFAETSSYKDPKETPQTRLGLQQFDRTIDDAPTGWKLRWLTASTLLRLWFHNPSGSSNEPEAEFEKQDAPWWRLTRYNSVLVNAADNSGKNVYVRDRAQYRRMLHESLALHRQLKREWPTLQKRYRSALPDFVSPQSWQHILEEKV